MNICLRNYFWNGKTRIEKIKAHCALVCLLRDLEIAVSKSRLFLFLALSCLRKIKYDKVVSA